MTVRRFVSCYCLLAALFAFVWSFTAVMLTPARKPR